MVEHEVYKWHQVAEMAKKIQQIADFQEMEAYSKCEHYHWDHQSSDCSCDHKAMKGQIFYPQNWCWKCPFYKPKEEEGQDD